jgi:hypothetical protein
MVISKRLGFSMEELNEMTIQSLVDISSELTKDPKKKNSRKATQADIDKFTGYRESE